jgi:hypothetical protein
MAVLRPHPHRGDTIAAGVVVLTTFAVVLDVRFAGTWASGVRFAVVGLLAAFVATMAVTAPMEEEAPRAYQSVLYVAGFVLVLLALGDLADALGAGGLASAGTVVWTGTLIAAGCAWLAVRRNSAIMTLLGALTGVVVVNAFVSWVFHPHGAQAFRWILLLCALALTVGAVYLRDLRRRHAVALADVAGLTVVALGATVLVELLIGAVVGRVLGPLSLLFGAADPPRNGPLGWELVLLVFGFGLIAYGCVERENVPGFLGVVTLGLFVAIAGPNYGGGASLLGWPVVLVVLAALPLVAGLRPRRPLPPEPDLPPLADAPAVTQPIAPAAVTEARPPDEP